MTRPELDRMLEQAVADAIGVPYRARPVKRPYKLRSLAAFRRVHPQHTMRGLQRA